MDTKLLRIGDRAYVHLENDSRIPCEIVRIVYKVDRSWVLGFHCYIPSINDYYIGYWYEFSREAKQEFINSFILNEKESDK